MSDNRKYNYLKLKENYFDEDAIVLLESMQDGVLYSNILLKLYLKSLKNGALYMGNIELLIGQSSTEGERKRRARLALQGQKALPKAGADKCPPYQADICPPELEKEIEKERARVRYRTAHPRRLWSVWKCLSDPIGTGRAES
mgnify:CR=1 FL=1